MTDMAYSLGMPNLTDIDERGFQSIFDEYSDLQNEMRRSERPPTIHEFVTSIMNIIGGLKLQRLNNISAIRALTARGFSIPLANKIFRKLVELRVIVPEEQ